MNSSATNSEVAAANPTETPVSLLIVDEALLRLSRVLWHGVAVALAGRPADQRDLKYGFIRMLGKLQSRLRPERIIVVWDGGLAEERMALLPEYKAQRAEMPADLEAQLDEIVRYLGAAGVYSFVKNGIEADDMIAVIAAQAVAAGLSVVIASSDKDFMQLVSDRYQPRLSSPMTRRKRAGSGPDYQAPKRVWNLVRSWTG